VIFEHPIVVDADGYEENVAGFGVEMPEHVVEQPDLRLAQLPIPTQSAFGKEDLRKAALDGHLDKALQYLPVEVVPRTAPHEVRAQAPDQSPQGPDVRPLPRRVAKGCTMRHQMGQQDVVDIAPVVHHEHDARVFDNVLVQGGETSLWADPDVVERSGDPGRQRSADPEVQKGVE